ncbi:MAG: hypothetical protein WBG86_05275 [Polyangiales bacterium]
MTKNVSTAGVYLVLCAVVAGCGTASALDAIPEDVDPADRSGENPPAEPRGSNPHGPYGFDVAENMARFAFDDAPLDEDGLPAYGNSFVTQGYIYPFGFLVNHDGANPDGSPAFPELVIGLWTCRGHFVGDGAKTNSGPWVVTTQVYDFFETPGYEPGKAGGRHNLISEGYEIADIDEPVRRAVTGATGGASAAGGDLTQELLGFNESGGVDLRLVIPQGFPPLIPYDELPTDAIAQLDQMKCIFDLSEGLICGEE